MFFVSSRARDKEKILSPHDAIEIADPSSMQDACHMNFVIDLAHRRVCGSVVEHRSAESEGLRFVSSWEFIIFFFAPRS